jgi:lysophospholipase L1-like esterase
LADYRERFQAMLEQFHQAAPRASLLVIGPPDRAKQVNRRWRTVDRMPSLVEAQRSAALGAGAAFYNLFEAMGASGSIDRWAQLREPLAQPDRVHLTQQGYALEAGWLYSEFLAGYSNRRRKE